MGDTQFRVVPDHMEADAALWSGASASLRRAVAAVPALDIDFGRFQASVGEKYAAADRAARQSIVTGEKRLGAMATNVDANLTRTQADDTDAGSRVDGAGRGGGSGGENGGTPVPAGDGQPGGKGTGHYETTLGAAPMPADPKDPAVTFDRHVDSETGEVTWTRREMDQGETVAVDGRDVERIPERADRVVVTMVDGEPRISYVDRDAATSTTRGSTRGRRTTTTRPPRTRCAPPWRGP